MRSYSSLFMVGKKKMAENTLQLERQKTGPHTQKNFTRRSGRIKVEFIQDRKRRSEARVDRRKTVLKKAHELVTMCGGNILMIYEQKNVTHIYTNIDDWWHSVVNNKFVLKKNTKVERLDENHNTMALLAMAGTGHHEDRKVMDAAPNQPSPVREEHRDLNFIEYKDVVPYTNADLSPDEVVPSSVLKWSHVPSTISGKQMTLPIAFSDVPVPPSTAASDMSGPLPIVSRSLPAPPLTPSGTGPPSTGSSDLSRTRSTANVSSDLPGPQLNVSDMLPGPPLTASKDLPKPRPIISSSLPGNPPTASSDFSGSLPTVSGTLPGPSPIVCGDLPGPTPPSGMMPGPLSTVSGMRPGPPPPPTVRGTVPGPQPTASSIPPGPTSNISAAPIRKSTVTQLHTRNPVNMAKRSIAPHQLRPGRFMDIIATLSKKKKP